MGIYAYAFQDKLADPNATDDEKYDYRVARVYDGQTNTWPIKPAAEAKRVYKYTWLGKTYYVDFGDCHHKFGSTNKRFLKDRNYLLPIGTLEIEKSEGSIVQNPGYEKACPTNEENLSEYPGGFVSNPQLAGIDFSKF
jgi:YHS domain-containing protein